MKEIIITSSVLILCIMLIRIIFKGKISSRLQYALWLLVALRLLVPSSARIHMAIGSIEQFRIMDLVEMIEARIGGVTERLENPVAFSVSLNSPIGARAAEFMLGKDLNLSGSADGPTSVFLAGHIGFSWLDVARGIWIGGMAVAALWVAMTNVIFTRRLHRERKEFALPGDLRELCCARRGKAGEEKGRHRIYGTRGVRVYTAEHLSSPCLYGLPGREAIYLTPDITVDADKMRHVVIHELCHRRHGDSFWSILRSVLVAVYWFNPLVWAAAVLSKRDCELACDEGALLLLGDGERISYGETLLSIITRKSRLSDIACTATTMTGNGRSVKERISFIAEKPRVLGVAVVAALLLIVAVSVAVFTRQPPYSGHTWEGEKILTAGDMQIRLPETIAGISGYGVEGEGDDIVIYQTASGKEAGRFRVLSYEEAVALVDEGRELIAVGDYGLNPYLKEYMESIRHTYTPRESITYLYRPEVPSMEEDAEQSDGYNPMLDSDWEVLPLEEEEVIEVPGEEADEDRFVYDYLPNETITSHEYIPNESVTTHEYTSGHAETAHHGTPANSQTQGMLSHEDVFQPENMDAAGGIAGTDSSDDTTYITDDDTTYMIDDNAGAASEESEESREYLPNEQITTVATSAEASSGRCYVYVKADYAGVEEKYLEEMAYINKELETAAGRVIVVSINQKIREDLFDALAGNRTKYLGDASKTGALVSALPVPSGLAYRDITLHTLQTDPEAGLSLDIRYELTARTMADVDDDILLFNAVMLFATIRNLDACNFVIADPVSVTHYRAEYLDDGEGMEQVDHFEALTYDREGLEEVYGELWSDAADRDGDYIRWLEELYVQVVDDLY